MSEWIVQPAVERKIRRLFVNFLCTFEDEERSKVYVTRIKDMVASEFTSRWSTLADPLLTPCQTDGKKGLEVVYCHMSLNEPTEIIASWLADAPVDTLKILNKALEEAVKRMFPDEDREEEEREGEEGARFFVRISQLPLEDKLRELRWVWTRIPTD